MQKIYQEPYEEGKLAGINLGIAEGKAEEKHTTARNMLLEGINDQLIARCTGLTIHKIEDIKNQIFVKN